MAPKVGNTTHIVLAEDISSYASNPLFLLGFAVRLLPLNHIDLRAVFAAATLPSTQTGTQITLHLDAPEAP